MKIFLDELRFYTCRQTGGIRGMYGELMVMFLHTFLATGLEANECDIIVFNTRFENSLKLSSRHFTEIFIIRFSNRLT